MGFDLKSETGEESQWTGVYWGILLDTARHYGWRPAGTAPPKGVSPREWGGSYFTNDGQLVTSDDVHALAASLEAAEQAPDLEEVSNGIYAAQVREAWKEADGIMAAFASRDAPVGVIARLARALRIVREPPAQAPRRRELPRLAREDVATALRELHEFCRNGPFRIW